MNPAASRSHGANVLLGETHHNSSRHRRSARHSVKIFLFKYGDFDLVPTLIGYKGKNMSDIAKLADAKLRIRGRGSGYLEDDGKGNWKEAPVHLQLAISVDKKDDAHFVRAVDLAVEQLIILTVKWSEFCECTDDHDMMYIPIFAFAEVSRAAAPLIAHHVQVHARPARTDPFIDHHTQVRAKGWPSKVPPPAGIQCFVKPLDPVVPRTDSTCGSDFENDCLKSLNAYYAGIVSPIDY